jgi:hypothetical protein
MEAKRDQATTAEATTNATITRPGAEIPPQPMSPAEANEAVTHEVVSWEGVSVHEHRFGGIEFRVGRRELGHLHPAFADLPFPKRVRDELVAGRRANPHHVLPDSGWVTVPMRTTAEVAGVIALFRQNYERATSG